MHILSDFRIYSWAVFNINTNLYIVFLVMIVLVRLYNSVVSTSRALHSFIVFFSYTHEIPGYGTVFAQIIAENRRRTIVVIME